MKPGTIPVRPAILDGTISFIQISSEFAKRAGDELNTRRQAEKKASDLIPGMLDHMVKTATVADTQRDQAKGMLSTHDGTMQLLKAAIDKIAELKTASGQTKKPGELGGPAGDTEKTAGDFNSLTGVVGARTSFVRESDRALLALIGQ